MEVCMIMIVLSLNIPNVDKISYKMTEYEAINK